ncbi:MAG: hypothetical protein NTY20_01010 [Candidatus Aenigmarchaeota archaeon]|nr:hypothetical protein [Candidatus Aenigmarchaeota archaeon]
MKEKMFLAALFAILLVLSAVAVQAQNTPIFNVILTKQNPFPAEPGKKVNIEVEVQNTGLGDANNIVVEISPSDPFRLLPGTEKTKTYTKISASSSVKVSYDLSIDENAFSNQYELEFRIYYANNPASYLAKKVMVNVQGQPDFIVESTWTSPVEIEPGGIVKVYAKVKNVGTGSGKQVQASLNSTSGLLIPVLSRGSVYMGDIAAGSDGIAEFELSVDTTSEHKTYPSILTLSYKDDSGVSGQKSFSLGIPVTGVISLEIVKTEANFERNVLQIEIANKGTADANSLEAKLVINGKTLGVDYVSQLKSTKKTTLEFPLVMEGQGQLILDYTSPGLKHTELTKDITVKFENPNGGNPLGTLAVIIIAAVVVYLLWRRFFRKKKKKSG